MIESGFGSRFHDLNYFEVGIFFYSLEFIIYLRAPSQNFVENHQINVIFSIFQTKFRQSLVQYQLLAHHLHPLLKYVDFSWNCFCHQSLFDFENHRVFKMFMIFFLHKIQSQCIVLNHFH